MDEEWVEVSAPTVEEATILALTRLGITRDRAKIEVLEEERKGFLGLGSRDARVRVSIMPEAPSARVTSQVRPTPKPVVPEPTPPAEKPAPQSAPQSAPQPAPSSPPKEVSKPREAAPAQEKRTEPKQPPEPKPQVKSKPQPEPQGRPAPKPAARQPSRQQPSQRPAPQPRQEPKPASKPKRREKPRSAKPAGAWDRDTVERVTQEVAGRVFAELRIDVETFWRDEDRPTLWIALKGADADTLVGPRAQTLDALQYMMRALIHRQVEGDYNLVLDADGYRERRQRSLVSLAKKMADRAVRIERTVRLHPMPANERRIIHMTLREDPRVTTQSKGSGRRRAVSIRPQTS